MAEAEQPGGEPASASDVALHERALKKTPFDVESVLGIAAGDAQLASPQQPFLDFGSGIAAQRAQRDRLGENDFELDGGPLRTLQFAQVGRASCRERV